MRNEPFRGMPTQMPPQSMGGFLRAAATDLPVGAVIVLVSSALLGAATIIRHMAQRLAPPPRPRDGAIPNCPGLTPR